MSIDWSKDSSITSKITVFHDPYGDALRDRESLQRQQDKIAKDREMENQLAEIQRLVDEESSHAKIWGEYLQDIFEYYIAYSTGNYSTFDSENPITQIPVGPFRNTAESCKKLAATIQGIYAPIESFKRNAQYGELTTIEFRTYTVLALEALLLTKFRNETLRLMDEQVQQARAELANVPTTIFGNRRKAETDSALAKIRIAEEKYEEYKNATFPVEKFSKTLSKFKSRFGNDKDSFSASEIFSNPRGFTLLIKKLGLGSELTNLETFYEIIRSVTVLEYALDHGPGRDILDNIISSALAASDLVNNDLALGSNRPSDNRTTPNVTLAARGSYSNELRTEFENYRTAGLQALDKNPYRRSSTIRHLIDYAQVKDRTVDPLKKPNGFKRDLLDELAPNSNTKIGLVSEPVEKSSELRVPLLTEPSPALEDLRRKLGMTVNPGEQSGTAATLGQI